MEEAAAVWLRDDEEGWLPGVVKKVDDDQIEVDVVDDDGNTIEAITLPTQEVKRRDADAKPVDDLISLAVLHEPAILHALRRRYASGEIYTFNGAILIAVNPFRKLALYTDDILERYANRGLLLPRACRKRRYRRTCIPWRMPRIDPCLRLLRRTRSKDRSRSSSPESLARARRRRPKS